MTKATKIVAVLKVFSDRGIHTRCHAEHDILMFSEEDEKISFAQELIDAGAFYSNEYNSWAIWCSS